MDCDVAGCKVRWVWKFSWAETFHFFISSIARKISSFTVNENNGTRNLS